MTRSRVIGLLGTALLLILAGSMVNQHLHYVDARLHAVKDHQGAFHGDVFHVLTFLRSPQDEEMLDQLGGLAEIARDTEAELIYAGQVIHMGLRSHQLAETFGDSLEWHAIVLQQFDSREAYGRYRQRPEVEAALAGFELTYEHGFKRSAALNVLLHQMFLGMRLWRQLTFKPDVLPFVPADVAGARLPPASGPLLKHADGLGQDAILIVNLARNGTPEQQDANADYGSHMLGLMADLQYGPMHLGSTVSLEHGHEFDQAMLVYYPGSRFFHELSSSTWFQSIIGDKQLADTQACITVPVTHLL